MLGCREGSAADGKGAWLVKTRAQKLNHVSQRAELHRHPSSPTSSVPLALLLHLRHVSCFMFRYVCVLSGRWISLLWQPCSGWVAGWRDGWLVVGETIACSRKHEILIMFIMPKGFVSRRCTHTAHVLARAVQRVASRRRRYRTRLIFIFKFRRI